MSAINNTNRRLTVGLRRANPVKFVLLFCALWLCMSTMGTLMLVGLTGHPGARSQTALAAAAPANRTKAKGSHQTWDDVANGPLPGSGKGRSAAVKPAPRDDVKWRRLDKAPPETKKNREEKRRQDTILDQNPDAVVDL